MGADNLPGNGPRPYWRRTVPYVVISMGCLAITFTVESESLTLTAGIVAATLAVLGATWLEDRWSATRRTS